MKYFIITVAAILALILIVLASGPVRDSGQPSEFNRGVTLGY